MPVHSDGEPLNDAQGSRRFCEAQTFPQLPMVEPHDESPRNVCDVDSPGRNPQGITARARLLAVLVPGSESGRIPGREPVC